MATVKELLNEFDEYSKTASVDERAAWLRKACEQRETEEPDDIVGISSLYNELGGLFRNNGRLEEGEEAFMTAIKLMETPVIGEVQGCKSCVLTANLDDDVWGKVYITQEKTSNYATIVNNLAGNYRLMGRYEDAINLFKRAQSIYAQNPDTPVEIKNSCINNLALVYIDMKKLDDAKECFLKILPDMEENAQGKYELATTYGNLAFVEAMSHNKQSAYDYVCKAEAIYAKILDPSEDAYKGIVQLKETISKM